MADLTNKDFTENVVIEEVTCGDYIGNVCYSKADDVYYGKLLNITDLVTYEGATMDQAKEAMVDAIADYKKFRQELNK